MKQLAALSFGLIFGHVLYAQPATDIQDAFDEGFSGHAYFDENDGQAANTAGSLVPQVLFESYGSEPKIFAWKDSKVSFQFTFPVDVTPFKGRIDMMPNGEAATLVEPGSEELAAGYDNFYLPHCANGVTGVKRWSRVLYKSIFPHVDQVFYSTPSGIRMSIICWPGFLEHNVRFEFHGQDSLKVDVSGFIKLFMSGQHVKIPEAVAYQVDNNTVITLPWSGKWTELNGDGMASLEFHDYDEELPLIFQIGPGPQAGGGGPQNLNDGLDWSTSIGEDNQFASQDWVTGATCHTTSGDLFLTGTHQHGPLGLQPGYEPMTYDFNTWVSKIAYAPGDPDQDAKNLWTTIVGGSEHDIAKAIFMNAANSALYVGGVTKSTNIGAFPILNPNDGTYWAAGLKGTADGLLLKVDPSTGVLAKKVLFGGSGRDVITAFTEDGDGGIWFSGITDSPTGAESSCNSPATAFPLCDPTGANYWQPNNAGGMDAFLTRFDATFHMTLSTFFGSSENDRAYDLAYKPAAVVPARRIMLVGRSLGSIPQPVVTGSFQQPGDAYKSAFIATFDGNGAQTWSSNFQRLNSFQAAALRDGKLAVLGYTHRYYADVAEVQDGSEPGSPGLANSCSAQTGLVSICDPGGGAYIDNTATNGDMYYAEFNPVTGVMEYSTFIGGGNEENPSTAFDQLAPLESDPFHHWRMLDLKVDEDENVYMLGTTANKQFGVLYPTQAAVPFYHRESPPDAGWDQSDVTLHCLLANRTLWWATTFGAWFDHVDDTNDYYYLTLGSDFGCDLALANGKALYWAGATGNDNFPTACPYPGTSYCEPFSSSNGGIIQGFATRMNLADLPIGLTELGSTDYARLSCWPNPGNGPLYIALQGELVTKGKVDCFDALGKLVKHAALTNGQCDLGVLAPVCYELRVTGAMGRPLGTVRFTSVH